jgi:hypothetical protein
MRGHMRASIYFLLLTSFLPLCVAGQQQPDSSSAQRRRDWAAKATADPRIAGRCLYKTAGELDEVLLIMCPGTTEQDVERVLANAQVGVSMYRIGFRIVIYSDGRKKLWGANLTEAGYARLPDTKTAESARLFFPSMSEDARKSEVGTPSEKPEPPLVIAVFEQACVLLSPWPKEGQQAFKNYLISPDNDFTVAAAICADQNADQKMTGTFFVELHITNHTGTAALFGIHYVTLSDARRSQAYVWEKHVEAELGWKGWTPGIPDFYWTDRPIAPDSSDEGIFAASLSPGTIGWRGGTSVLFPLTLKIPIGRKAYEFVFDTAAHAQTYVQPQPPAPAPIPPHKISPVEWNGVHIGSPINDPAVKTSGCSYMGEGSEEFSKRLLALSSGATMSVCRLIADCPPPSNSPVKVCSEDLNHAWIGQIWVVTRQEYSSVRAGLESTHGAAEAGLYRLLSNETKPSYNLWQLQGGVKIAAKQASLESLLQDTSASGQHLPVSVIYMIE